jgi:hypothetical protein
LAAIGDRSVWLGMAQYEMRRIGPMNWPPNLVKCI